MVRDTQDGSGLEDPVILRAYNNNHKGATAFFRNRPFIERFFSTLQSVNDGPIKILVHACSLGAEPYSLAMWWLHKVLPTCAKEVNIEISATDIDSDFLDFAQQARYPSNIFGGMTPQEQSWFLKADDNVQVPRKVRRLVRFLPPMNFVTDEPGETFDAVLVMNALTYVSPEEQSAALTRCASYCRHVLGITAFRPDTVKADLDRLGYMPCMGGHREIHEAWGDRLAPGPVPADSPDYSWRLPPYETDSPDFAYRYGALFKHEVKT